MLNNKLIYEIYFKKLTQSEKEFQGLNIINKILSNLTNLVIMKIYNLIKLNKKFPMLSLKTKIKYLKKLLN